MQSDYLFLMFLIDSFSEHLHLRLLLLSKRNVYGAQNETYIED